MCVCDDFHNHPPVGVAIPSQDDSSSDDSTTFLPDHIQVTKRDQVRYKPTTNDKYTFADIFFPARPNSWTHVRRVYGFFACVGLYSTYPQNEILLPGPPSVIYLSVVPQNNLTKIQSF